MKYNLKYYVIIIVLFLIELLFSNKIINLCPNLILCFIVYLYCENKIFTKFVVICGLVESGLLGVLSPIIAYLLFIPTCNYLKKSISNSLMSYILLVFICSIIYEIVFCIFGIFNEVCIKYLSMIYQILMNTFVSFILFFVLERFQRKEYL